MIEEHDKKTYTQKNSSDILKKKFVSNRPFNIQKALEVKVPKIVIPDFPKNIDIEKTAVTRMFLKPFNEIYETEITIEDLMFSRSNFRAFIDFILYCSIKGHILIEKDQAIGDFIQAFEKLQKKYMQNLRSIEKYYDEIVRSIYYPQGINKKDPKIKEEMYGFEQAYALTKLVWRNEPEETQKKYFENLKQTIENILTSSSPNLDKIIIVLLHDIVQKIPAYEHVIRKIYGEDIAHEVYILRQKHWENYLTKEENEEYTTTHDENKKNQLKNIGEERRNKEYFTQFESRWEEKAQTTKRNQEENNDILMKKFVKDRPFNIQKALEIKIPKIVIQEIPKDKDLEDTEIFHAFLQSFNEIYETSIDIEDLMYSKSNFRKFTDFMLYCGIKWHLSVSEDYTIGEFIQAFENLQIKYMQNVRSIEKYDDEIIRRIYYPQGLTKKDSIVREDMYQFEQAYSLVKLIFKNMKRKSQRRYFEHLKGTMEIAIRELPNPNLNKIIIALLHDIVEDIPGYEKVIREIYWDYIADGVEVLSKKDWKVYLTEEETKKYATSDDNKKKERENIGKERRNQDYFGHLDELNDDYLDIKFADRIHNLRDMDHLSTEEIEKKVAETEKYFLHVAEKRNPTAHKLLTIELEHLNTLLKTK